METYPGITPAVFWDLDDDEYDSLKNHLQRRAKEADDRRKEIEAMRMKMAKARHG